jgi:hypothetical protein
MVDPLRTGGIYRMQLTSPGLGSPRPLLRASPCNPTPREAIPAASPRFTRPKPEVILDDHGAAMRTPATTRFSLGFHAVALAAPVADVVRRAAEEHFGKQQQELEEQQQYQQQRPQVAPEHDPDVDYGLLQARRLCAPPWAVDDLAPMRERAVASGGDQEPLGADGGWKTSGAVTAPQTTTLRDPADIFGLAPPLAAERKPMFSDKHSCAGDDGERVVPPLAGVPRTLFAATGEEVSPVQVMLERPEHKALNAEVSEPVSEIPAAATRADITAERAGHLRDPHSDPNSTLSTAWIKLPRKRGKLSEVLRLQRSIATAVWTDSVAVSELSEPIIVSDDDGDDKSSPQGKRSKSTPRRTRSAATYFMDGPGSGMSLSRTRRAARSKPTALSDGISRKTTRPSRSDRCLKGPKNGEGDATGNEGETTSKQGRISRLNDKQKITKRPIHKFDCTIKSAIKNPERG